MKASVRRWVSRPLASAGEFAILRALVRAGWRDHGPINYSAPGSLDWWRAADPSADVTTQVRLWSPDTATAPIGWSWSRGAGQLDWFVDPGLSRDDEMDLRTAMLTGHRTACAATGIETWRVFAAEGTVEQDVAARHGESHDEHTMIELLADLRAGETPLIAPPAGYSIRPVDLPAELRRRVDVHRAAFHPSRFTVEKYESLAALGSPFDPALDFVAVAPDGSLAGFAVGWLDAVAGVGEIEPLGTHPDHRGRGLARALASTLIHAFRAGGARYALVYCETGNDAAESAYRVAGCRPEARSLLYEGSTS